MPKENSNETAGAVKVGQAPEVPANGERGSDAHATEGAQANEFTAEAVASLLKSDLTEAVGEPEPEAQTPPEKETPADNESGEKPNEKVKGNERPEVSESRKAAQSEVESWKEAIAELEQKLEAAEGDETKTAELEKELNAAKADMAEWEKIAKGEASPGQGNVPEALQQAIAEWKEKGKGELPPELQELVDDRIHRATSQRDSERTAREAAEAKAAELEAQLAQRPQMAAGGLPTIEELDKLQGKADALIRDLENVVDGTATEEEAARVAKVLGMDDLDSPEGQRAAKRNLREVERYAATLPGQRQQVQNFRTQEAQLEPTAKEWFPFLYDKSHADYQEAQEVLRIMPELRQRTPAHRFALGTYVLGLRELRRLHPEAFRGKTLAARAALPRKAPAKSPVSGGGAAAPNGAKTRARGVEEASARAEFDKNPTAESAKRLLKIGLRAA
jgi:hypothetical protein